jgi:hypothetical protein
MKIGTEASVAKGETDSPRPVYIGKLTGWRKRPMT